MNEERENGAQVEHEESSAEQGPEELPDPDREGPTPDSENEEAEEGSEGG
jgi:hypothetical protein